MTEHEKVVAAGDMVNPLPCPWCGNAPQVSTGVSSGWFVMCLNEDCPVAVETVTHCKTREEVVALWNTRK